MTTDADYARGVYACLTACTRWKEQNPGAQLRFNPLRCRVPPGHTLQEIGGLIAGLGTALQRGVAGNSATRKLLESIERATGRGASVMMVEFAIKEVFGIPSALTRWEVSDAHKKRMD